MRIQLPRNQVSAAGQPVLGMRAGRDCRVADVMLNYQRSSAILHSARSAGRRTAGCPSGQRERSVKPSAQPTLVRTQHLPPAQTPGQRVVSGPLPQRSGEVMAAFARTENLQGAEFIGADLRGARFIESDLSEVVMRGVRVEGADIDAPWLSDGDSFLRVNGVDVIPFVEAELNRRFPGRADRGA